MKIYIAIWEDRHTDTTVHAFRDSDKAIEWARGTAKENCSYQKDYAEHSVKGWLFCAVYSCEGDSLRVVAVELDDD